jgi:hypothetical protein
MSKQGHIAAQLFRMDEYTWERHASPWSVWTRVASMPLILVAIWSHTWIGVWSLLAIVLVALWLWLNPRLFPPPARKDGWSAKTTFGERVWLNRKEVPIPEHHVRVANIMTTISAVGFVIAIAGAYMNELLPTVAGGIVSWFAKMWFCDRMVWLYEDMKDKHPSYARWAEARGKEVR